jgi:citrate synthase
MELAITEGLIGPHVKLALAIEDLLFERKKIRLNVDGANAAILSDLGFDPELGLGVFIVGRVPGILAHIREEKMDEKEFRRFCDLDDVVSTRGR